MVKRYHASFPSLSYGFNSRYPLQTSECKANSLGQKLVINDPYQVYQEFTCAI